MIKLQLILFVPLQHYHSLLSLSVLTATKTSGIVCKRLPIIKTGLVVSKVDLSNLSQTCYRIENFPFPGIIAWKQEEACVNHQGNADARFNHYSNVKHLPPGYSQQSLHLCSPTRFLFCAPVSQRKVSLMKRRQTPITPAWHLCWWFNKTSKPELSPENSLNPLSCFVCVCSVASTNPQGAEGDALSEVAGWHSEKLSEDWKQS